MSKYKNIDLCSKCGSDINFASKSFSNGVVNFSYKNCRYLAFEDMSTGPENLLAHLTQALQLDTGLGIKRRALYLNDAVAMICAKSDIFDFDMKKIKAEKAIFNKVEVRLGENNQETLSI